MTQTHEFADHHPAHALPPRHISSEGLQDLFDFSPDALILVSEEGRIVAVNSLAAACFGYAEQELASAPLVVLLPPRFREQHRTHQQQYFATPRARPMGVGLQLFGQRKDGSAFPVDISLRPLLYAGTLHALAASVISLRRLQ